MEALLVGEYRFAEVKLAEPTVELVAVEILFVEVNLLEELVGNTIDIALQSLIGRLAHMVEEVKL